MTMLVLKFTLLLRFRVPQPVMPWFRHRSSSPHLSDQEW